MLALTYYLKEEQQLILNQVDNAMPRLTDRTVWLGITTNERKFWVSPPIG